MIVFDNSIYASGVATIGKEGNIGNDGKDCNCIYYVPYDLRTSNNIDFVLNKIKNNQIISSNESSEYLPDNKEYSTSDFFYSDNGYIYKLNDEMTDFIEIGIIDELKCNFTNINLNSNILKIYFDSTNYNCIVYYIDEYDCYPASSIIESSGQQINFNGNCSNILIKYVSKITGNSYFYKYIN